MKDLETQVEMGSDNVLEDLGFPDAAEMSLKVQLAVKIIDIMRQNKLTQSQVAKRTGLKQPDISAIVNARLDGISVERLFSVLNKLGKSIEIRVVDNEVPNARTLVLA